MLPHAAVPGAPQVLCRDLPRPSNRARSRAAAFEPRTDGPSHHEVAHRRALGLVEVGGCAGALGSDCRADRANTHWAVRGTNDTYKTHIWFVDSLGAGLIGAMAGSLDQGVIASLIESGRLRQEPSKKIAKKIVELVEDSEWPRGLDHPVRVAILRLLHGNGSISPARVAEQLDNTSLGTVSYHFRKLKQLGLIEEAQRIPRRGAIEHLYRLTQPD